MWLFPADGDRSVRISGWRGSVGLPPFQDVVVILDVYHLLQAFAAFIVLCIRNIAREFR